MKRVVKAIRLILIMILGTGLSACTLQIHETEVSTTPTIPIATAVISPSPAMYQPITSNINLSAIKIDPEPKSFLYDSQGNSSYVALEDVTIATGLAEKDYVIPKPPPNKFLKGEIILFIIGIIQNTHPENTYIALWAEGYDKAGTKVGWTLDASHIAGQFLLNVDKEEREIFVLHMNLSDDIESLHIHAHNYNVMPP